MQDLHFGYILNRSLFEHGDEPELKKILLIAGSDHRNIVNSLKQSLLSAEIELHIITMKSHRDLLLRLSETSLQAIWLVSPQTIHDISYKNIHQILKRKGISILPVVIVPVDNLPFSGSRIQINRNLQLTASEIIQALNSNRPFPRRMRPSKLTLGLILVSLVLIMGLSTLILIEGMQPEELSLPTFVALNPQSLSSPITVNEILITVSSSAESSFDVSQTITLESTNETDNLSSTAEPESTESLDMFEVTDEPTQSILPDIGGVLLADFSADPQRGDAPLKVNITNLSTGSISAYRWDYETDGIIDNSDFEPPTIIYDKPGIYTLTLTTRDSSGTIVESENVIEVYDSSDSTGSTVSNGATFASFETSPSSGKYPLSVRFVNRSVGLNLRYEWDLNGDSRVDFVGPSPSAYEYTQPGTFTARLDAIAPDGSRDRAQAQINVYSTSPNDANEIIYDVNSQANFEISASRGTVPFRVSINNLSLGGNNSYEWDFNADNIPDSASLNPPQQRYAIPGQYTISLTVHGFDRYGIPKVSRAQAQVIALALKPDDDLDETYDEFDVEADFVADIIQGTAPLTVAFYNYSTGEITNYQWDFNSDGVIDSTEFEPIHTFSTTGIYEVKLKVSDGSATSETSLDIEVLAPQSTKTPLPPTTAPITATPTLLATSGGATLTRTSTLTLTKTATINVTNASATPIVTPNGTVVTMTPMPTFTVIPTTSVPPTNTASPMPIPTNTPTNTASPAATITPIPTNTATTTNVPTLTNTPIPTNTPEA